MTGYEIRSDAGKDLIAIADGFQIGPGFQLLHIKLRDDCGALRLLE
jgi:hypothetical protein